MAKMKPETKEKIKYAVRHPVVWWRGADLPEEDIRPWEGGIQFFGEALKGFMGGFTGMRGRLYEGKAEGKIPPNWLSVKSVVNTTWDAVNDPMIGSYMDYRRASSNTYRLIMRINATLSPIFTCFLLLNLGISPLTRVIMWGVFDFLWDIMSTANGVSDSKIWAGITPHTKQRGYVQVCKTLGNQMSQALSAISLLLLGLKDVLNLDDYRVMVYGALLFAPLTIFCRWLPSFAKQRVDFTQQVAGEDNKANGTEKPPTFRESFAVVRHNRWFMMNTILNFVTVLTPSTDGMFLYRFLLPQTGIFSKTMIGGKPINGEMILFIKNTIMGNPGTFLQPFALQAIRRLGGELNFIRFKNGLDLVSNILKFVIGYKTFPRLMVMFTIEMIQDIFNKWSPVAGNQINYQMLDYVEWKTGQRSEGMTMAVDGMFSKLITRNAGSIIDNAVRDWSDYQGWDIPVEQQPTRFLNTIWPLMFVGPIIDGALWLGARLWFKYPHDPKEVEADLVERRALAAKLKEEIQPQNK
ncbi:MAG: MFS transporter [Oscillospiraceae bacterium]|nr:MFS transporter [Oscillospiraceae bacterium]